MRTWLRRQCNWLVVELLAAYAPNSNLVEALWSDLKEWNWPIWPGRAVEEITAAAERGIQRIRSTPYLAPSRFFVTAAYACSE